MSTAAPLSPEVVSIHDAPLPTLEQLPDDLDTLKRMIVELIVTLREERQDKEGLRHRVQLLLQRLYAPRSERFNPNQPLLFAEGLAPTTQTSTAAVEQDQDEPEPAKSAKRRGGHGRRRLPENLPQRPVHHELTDAERICICGQPRIDIGTEDGGKQLDWQPASYFVWQHWIHKYLCADCAARGLQARMAAEATKVEVAQSDPAPAPPAATAAEPSAAAVDAARPIGPPIISAPKPPAPIDKGLPGPGLLAHIIVSKYSDHLPLYRQENISEREGVLIRRSTSCDGMAAAV